MNDPIDQFRQAIAAAVPTPPDVILDDGAIVNGYQEPRFSGFLNAVLDCGCY